MRLFGVKVDSLLSPQTRYLATTKQFIPEYGEEKPKIVALDVDGRVLRELILLREPILPGRRIQSGYKLEVSSSSDGRLASLSGMFTLTLVPRVLKGDKWLRGELLVLGRKINPERILIFHDIPVLGNSGKEVIAQLQKFLEEWGIHTRKLPTIVRNVRTFEKVKARVIDIDFLMANFLP
ncbi:MULTISPECIES: hypothetical protein [Metallosphaera]|uniref:hypothetical protein n=1 Tax=Metallosphaera TaxID=41980 RepID=UPI001F069E53|nr:hypothetical protein [Metallosphaera sedula]MCH1770125.1 hypothetical protein [Metallosphaera sedula]MCP6728041.1 hypothetical protein [Metallosphaera sedula]